MVFVDNLVVARLGPEALASMAMATSIVVILQVLCLGMLSPISALVSQAVGAGRPEDVGPTLRRGMFLALAMSAVIVMLFTISDHLLLALGQDPALVPQAKQFLLALSWGIPATLGYVTMRQLTEGVSDTHPSVVVAACAAVLNLGLDVGLVFGMWGFPRLELVGAGIATASASWFMFLCMLAYVRWNPRYREYCLGSTAPDRGHSLAEIIRVGLPLGGSLLAEIVFFCGATLVMGVIGMHAQASHQIALNAASVTFMVPLGISFAVAIRVSRARGARDTQGIRLAGQAGLILALGAQTLAAACFLLIPGSIAHLYTSNPALTPLAVSLLRIGGLFQWFDGIQVVGMGMLRGLLDTRLPFVLTVISYWLVGTPCALYLAFGLKWGPVGLWFGMVAGLGAAAILLQLRFWKLVPAVRSPG